MKNKALVIGKFMDFHVGHVALIDYARGLAKDVLVILCTSPHDRRDPDQREQWIHDTFGNRIDLQVLDYASVGLSGKEESDREVSHEWAQYIDLMFPEVDLLVGSEDYVSYMAESMGIAYTLFDQERKAFPCSSTSVNKGDFRFRAKVAKMDLVKKVGFVGPESTGKTLAAYYASTHAGHGRVEEAARSMILSYYTMLDLEQFALQQQIDINEGVMSADSGVLLVDSTAVTTMAYSDMMFDTHSDTISELAGSECMALYLVFSPEVPLVQDGTREMSDESRWEMYEDTQTFLRNNGRKFTTITGSCYEDRLSQVKEAVRNV